MGVLRRDRVRCLMREYDQLTGSDTVSGTHTYPNPARQAPAGRGATASTRTSRKPSLPGYASMQ
jgi:hypothetical protein